MSGKDIDDREEMQSVRKVPYAGNRAGGPAPCANAFMVHNATDHRPAFICAGPMKNFFEQN
jgi:hypothetical protein